MKCNINNVPGYTDTSKTKNKPLEMKIERELDKAPLKKRHPSSIHTEWDVVEGRLILRDTPQSPGFFAYESASYDTKQMVDFALRHDTNFRINKDGSLTLESISGKNNKSYYEGRKKVRTMKELRAFLGY
jgi:hypothetical protein